MATYAELTVQYEQLERGGGDKWRFQQAHPKWWENYKAAKAAGTTGTAPPAETTPPTDFPQPVTNPDGSVTHPPYPDGSQLTVHPDGTRTITYLDGTTKDLAPGQSITDPALGGGGTRPPKPTSPLPEGWTWVWDDDVQSWIPQQGEAPVDLAAQADLRAELRDILDQFGLATEDTVALIEQAVKEDWSPTKFTQKLRQSKDYLDNPLFAANVARAAAGNRFLSEGEVIGYASKARDLARQFGYQAPSDAYIAQGIGSGLSMAEIEHRFRVQDRVNQFGAGVGLVYREIIGRDPTDQDLFEIFDPETSTDEIDDALRQAEYRGRPFTLGLGIRTEAEARAAEMLGITPDEWFSRFQGVAQNAPRFERLRAVEDLITQGLPSNFGEHLSTAENGILIRALVFQDQAALAQLQDITAREVARFKQSGAPVSAGGQAVGLLSPTERASFG